MVRSPLAVASQVPSGAIATDVTSLACSVRTVRCCPVAASQIRTDSSWPTVASQVLPVRTVHLDDPDARCGDVAGQPGAVTAGPFDAGQAHGAEPAQPAQQAGVAGRGGRELLDAEQAADGIERGGDMGICVSVYAAGNRGAAGNGACFFYDGHCHPFLRLRDGTHPLAVGPVNPGLLHRTGRSDRQRRRVP